MSQKVRPSLFPVFFVLFIDNFGFSVIFATFGPLFVDPSFGFVTAEMSDALRNMMLGVALALFPLGQFFGCPFLGDIADRFGRKKAFYITIVGATIGFIISGWSILTGNYLILILSRLFTGFFSGNLSICLASIADLSPDEHSRAKNFSMIIIVTGISWMIAMLMGGYLSNPQVSSHFNPALPFYVTAALSLLSLVGIASLFKETHPSKEKFKLHLLKGVQDILKTFHIKELRMLYIVYMFWILGWGLAFQWFSPYALQVYKTTPLNVTWAQFLVGIAWIIGGYFINDLLIKRFHARSIVVVGTALTTLCLVGMAISDSFIVFALFFTIACFPSAISWPNTLNLISMNAPADIQGKIMGISQSSQSVGFILATLVGGFIAATTIHVIYPLTAAFLCISWILIFARHLMQKKTTPTT